MINIKRLLAPTYQLPTKFWSVPSGRDKFLKGKEYLKPKWVFKYLKRKLYCWLFVQKFGRIRMLNAIENNHNRILWINWAAPSLGDSLMDLSARVMLKDKDVILLTHPKNSVLYQVDEVFSSVYDCPKVLLDEHGEDAFDLVICDAFSPRVFKQKRLVAPNVPFVGMYGFLNGFEVHRTYFAFSRMAELVDLPKDTLDSYQVKPILYNERTDQFKRSVAIAVGGEWDFRIYDKWLQLVDYLFKNGFQVCLFGSKNGEGEANLIERKNATVKNFVGKKNLTETINELSKYEFFIGADGGLWHIACGLDIPSVVLFADCEIFNETGKRVLRDTHSLVTKSLYDQITVKNITVSSVISAFIELTQSDMGTTSSDKQCNYKH